MVGLFSFASASFMPPNTDKTYSLTLFSAEVSFFLLFQGADQRLIPFMPRSTAYISAREISSGSKSVNPVFKNLNTFSYEKSLKIISRAASINSTMPVPSMFFFLSIKCGTPAFKSFLSSTGA